MQEITQSESSLSNPNSMLAADDFEAGGDALAGPPKTATVLTLLAAAAVIFSYLIAYALTNALVSAGLISQWQPGSDPRPRNMLIGFCSLMLLFTILVGSGRVASKRQLRRIDAMEEESD